MTQHALVVAGVVHEIMSVPQGFELGDCYAQDIVEQCVAAPDDVLPGWTYDGKAFAAPVAPPAPPASTRQIEVSALFDALSTSKRAAISQDNRERLIARGAKGPVGADDPKVVRAAADVAKLVSGFTPAAWFDVALAPPA